MYMRWYADNMWLMVPAQQFVKKFFMTLKDYPFQAVSSLSAGNIGYQTVQQQKLKRLLDKSIQN